MERERTMEGGGEVVMGGEKTEGCNGGV